MLRTAVNYGATPLFSGGAQHRVELTMQEYPLFPRAIRLVLYAGAALTSLASIPTIITHARKLTTPITQDDSALQDGGSVATPVKHSGTISILPVGPQTELHRQAELAALRDKLASTPPAH